MPTKVKRKVKGKVKGKSKKARRQLRNTRVSGASKWRKWKSRGLARARYYTLSQNRSKRINPESSPKTPPVKTQTPWISKFTTNITRKTPKYTKTYPGNGPNSRNNYI